MIRYLINYLLETKKFCDILCGRHDFVLRSCKGRIISFILYEPEFFFCYVVQTNFKWGVYKDKDLFLPDITYQLVTGWVSCSSALRVSVLPVLGCRLKTKPPSSACPASWWQTSLLLPAVVRAVDVAAPDTSAQRGHF